MKRSIVIVWSNFFRYLEQYHQKWNTYGEAVRYLVRRNILREEVKGDKQSRIHASGPGLDPRALYGVVFSITPKERGLMQEGILLSININISE